MKKIICFIFIIMYFNVFLSACDNHSHINDNSDISEYSQSSQANKKYNTVLYQQCDGVSVFNVDCTEEFETFEYKSDSAEKSKRVNIRGVSYDLIYENSANINMADLSVDVYSLKGVENAKVMINTDNGEIVKYANIPYDGFLNSEKDYVEFIESIILDNYDLSDYVYETMTRYYSVFENGAESKNVDYFHVKEENEIIGWYSFFYTKKVEGISTNEHISASFSEDDFSLEIYDFDYDTSAVSEIVSGWSELENDVKTYLRSNVDTMYTINDVSLNEGQLFFKNEIPYVMFTANVEFTIGEQTESYTLLVRTVTKINNE